MSLMTLDMVRSCSCAVMNIWWLAILAYFIVSICVAVYVLGFLLKYNDGRWSIHSTVLMMVTAIAFVYTTVYYLRLLQHDDCKCVDKNYLNSLDFLVKIRYAALTILSSFGVLFIIVALAFLAKY